MIPDVFGLPLVGLATDEGAAFQAAVFFFRHSGEDLSYDGITGYAVMPDPMFEPDEVCHVSYQNFLAK